jgi:hypothetical protein
MIATSIGFRMGIDRRVSSSSSPASSLNGLLAVGQGRLANDYTRILEFLGFSRWL